MENLPLISELRAMQLITYFDVAASTYFVLDYLLTFGLELQYVWKAPRWRTVHALFVIQRYLPIFDTVFLALFHQLGGSLTVKQCRFAYHIGAVSMGIGVGFGEAILALRTWAVWNRNKRVGVALLIFFISIWGVTLFVVVGFLRSLAFGEEPYPGFRGCLIIRANHSMTAMWCLLMAWDTRFMLIPGLKLYQAGSSSVIIRVIYRDGIIYYVYLCALSSVNIAVVQALPYSYQHLLTSFERTFHSAMSSRVLLNIRATLDAPYNLTELVVEACGADDDDDNNSLSVACSGSVDNGLGIELREWVPNAQAQADADVESQGDSHEVVPGGRVAPLPRVQTDFGVDAPVQYF